MRARKRFGQHFLEPAWADKLVAAIEPQPGDRFLEIGPGPGALTLRLAPLVEHLIAVELDRDMVAALASRVPANVTLIERDFLEFDFNEIAADLPVRVAGNLPYNVSSPILFRLLDTHRRLAAIADANLMVQREVADRITARPATKDYGVLAILVGLQADVRPLLQLPPGAFRPAPKVRSTVLHLDFRPPSVEVSDPCAFEEMVRSMFTLRRKTLGNALEPYAASRGVRAEKALASARIDPRRRPETLQLEELARLAEFFSLG